MTTPGTESGREHMVTSEAEGKYVPAANGCWARTRPGFRGTNKTRRRCLSLWSPGSAGEMDRVNAVHQVAINAMRENKVGVEAAIIISRVVRKGLTEKVASEQRRRGEGSRPFRHLGGERSKRRWRTAPRPWGRRTPGLQGGQCDQRDMEEEMSSEKWLGVRLGEEHWRNLGLHTRGVGGSKEGLWAEGYSGPAGKGSRAEQFSAHKLPLPNPPGSFHVQAKVPTVFQKPIGAMPVKLTLSACLDIPSRVIQDLRTAEVHVQILTHNKHSSYVQSPESGVSCYRIRFWWVTFLNWVMRQREEWLSFYWRAEWQLRTEQEL